MSNPSRRTKINHLTIGVFLVCALMLSGCESPHSPELLRNPNYSSGWSDGCQTGQSRVAGFDETVTRNNALSQIVPEYDIGWRDGYAACGSGDFDTNDGATREIFRNTSEHYETAPY